MLGRETSVTAWTVSSALAELISCSQILGRGESRKVTVPYFGLVGITRAENVPVHSPGIYDDASVRTTSVVNPTPASSVLGQPHDDVFPSRSVEDDMFFAYHGPWERHLQESSWPSQSVEHGLDPSRLVLGQYLDPGFPVWSQGRHLLDTQRVQPRDTGYSSHFPPVY